MKPGQFSVSLFTPLGRLIDSRQVKGKDNIVIATKQMSSGVYIVKIDTTAMQPVIQRIVIP